MTRLDERLTLELDRIIPAHAARMFSAFTSANELAQWWGPGWFHDPERLTSSRAWDGPYRIEMQPPEGEAVLS